MNVWQSRKYGTANVIDCNRFKFVDVEGAKDDAVDAMMAMYHRRDEYKNQVSENTSCDDRRPRQNEYEFWIPYLIFIFLNGRLFRSKNHPERRVSAASKTTASSTGRNNSSTNSSRPTSEEGSNKNGLLDKQDDQDLE